VNVALKEFQLNAVGDLVMKLVHARREILNKGDRQVIVLSSPTGSGKTLMATALMERIREGDNDLLAPDRGAVFLWLSDQPDLNEQTKRKILGTSAVFAPSDVVVIDNAFDQEVFATGKIYFLNIQKLSKSALLGSPGDGRANTIWDTINNTSRKYPGSFLVVIDEAHKGMLQRPAEAAEAATIVQRFIKGQPGVLDAMKMILGISATPARLTDLLRGTGGLVARQVEVPISDVRDSGLIKDKVFVFHPDTEGPTDWSLLEAATKAWSAITTRWADYCAGEGIPLVRPILVVQVEDGSRNRPSATDLKNVLEVVESAMGGKLGDDEIAHSFQEDMPIKVGGRAIRRIAPPDIQDDQRLKVVIFKLSLNTGWDCPRAEVMMSFRRAADHTSIAQLIGRMVRTPLARRVEKEELLNTVNLYLPNFDRTAVDRVAKALNEPGDDRIASDVERGADSIELDRATKSDKYFALLESLPTYQVTRSPKMPHVRRLVSLGRVLEQAQIATGTAKKTKDFVMSRLERARGSATRKGSGFQRAVDGLEEIVLKRVAMDVAGNAGDADETKVRLNNANLEDLFDLCDKRLGEGLHLEYVRRRTAKGVAVGVAQRELVVLLGDDAVLQRLQEDSQEEVMRLLAAYQPAINQLDEEDRALLSKIRRSSPTPDLEFLKYPVRILASKDDTLWAKHIYARPDGKYPCKVTGWEKVFLKTRLKPKETVAWLRNPPRKSWSFSIVYEDENAESANMYPDFIVFRRQSSGLVMDIVEPHRATEGDASRKIVGLARYAEMHPDAIGRIELVTKLDDEEGFRIIDLKDEKVRTIAKAVNNTQTVVALFKQRGKAMRTVDSS